LNLRDFSKLRRLKSAGVRAPRCRTGLGGLTGRRCGARHQDQAADVLTIRDRRCKWMQAF